MATWHKPGRIRNLNGTQPTKRTMWKGEERIERVPASAYRKFVNAAGTVVRVVIDSSNEKNHKCQQALVVLDMKQKQGMILYDECPIGNPHYGHQFEGKRCDKFMQEQAGRTSAEERYRMWVKDAAEKQGQGQFVEPFSEVVIPSEDFCCKHVQDEVYRRQEGEMRKCVSREHAAKSVTEKTYENDKAFQKTVLSKLDGPGATDG